MANKNFEDTEDVIALIRVVSDWIKNNPNYTAQKINIDQNKKGDYFAEVTYQPVKSNF